MPTATSRMTAKQLLPVAGIALSAFILNTSEFMPIGLLTDISQSFGISEATCGIMITVYAWAVMVLSLPLMIFASRFKPKQLMLAIIAVFAAGQFCSAVAPSFVALVFSRLLVACAHAIFWSVASPFAVRVVGEEHGPVAIGLVATGSSIAMTFGMPLGRMVGLALGWRMTLTLVGIVSVCVVAYLAAMFPGLERGERFTLDKLPGLARNRALIAIYVITVLFATAYYTGYSYIEPFLGQVAHLPADLVTAALMVFGAFGLLGSWLFSRLYERMRGRFLTASVAGAAGPLLLLLATGVVPWLAFALCSVWGICATAFNVACQAEVIHVTDDDSSAVAMSVFSGLFNLGIGTGTAIGGAVTSGVGVAYVGVVGGLIGVAGVAWCLLALLPRLRHVTR